MLVSVFLHEFSGASLPPPGESPMTTDMFRNFDVVGDVESVVPEPAGRQLKQHVSIADSDECVPTETVTTLVAVSKDPPMTSGTIVDPIGSSESDSSTSHGVPCQPAVNGHAKRKALMNSALQAGFDSINYVCF